ncbi:tetratricopeptide (TPR) repeat protein [Labrys wisconsinensis]|uniref:Tetratricopeptide (TPR) repeat protein n=2 Tax=Labrys wisconsinensis TaxID=425677 RepID=A0ABU0J9T5_9HYPH|nr:tetratricopeptide (TPR) repeat protein [Labrys wisconsinensis]
MMPLHRSRLIVALMAATVIGTAATPATAARRVIRPADTLSVTGGFLAGRLAASLRDNQSASTFYQTALRASPNNLDLLDRTFLAMLSAGEMDRSFRLAERLVAADKLHRIGRLALGVRALKARQYVSARTNLDLAAQKPVLDLIAPLLSAWTYAGAGETAKGIDAVDKLKGEDWYTGFRDFSAGMALDLAGDRKNAVLRLKAAADRDPSAVRITEAYARALARNGQRDEALKVLKAYDDKLPRHPAIRALTADIQANKPIGPTVRTAQEGASDMLVGLAAPLAKQGGTDYALIFFQLALYLNPDNASAQIGLADLYEDLKQPERAVALLEQVRPTNPLKRNAEIELGGALDQLDKTDEAVSHLKELIRKDPKDLDAIISLGGIYQGRKKFAEAADAFTQALEVIGTPTQANWSTFYFRGVAYERTKQWPKAEADFKKALELFPDQPSVLNYLGYSWIDQGVHLDEGMAMIRKAVDQRPDDGYIVDSLGWAYYKLGKYDDAVKQLERAVTLKPSDPTINDHLGDAYWRVGRKLEATFQWHHAKDANPEREDLAKIELKLKEGLKDTAQAADTPKPASGG